jgi:hypothetical protein
VVKLHRGQSMGVSTKNMEQGNWIVGLGVEIRNVYVLIITVTLVLYF